MKTDLNLQDLRVDYGRDPRREEAINPNPLKQFHQWFQEASDAGIAEPNAMSLATSDSSGHIACRTVLLKGFDDRGFVFFTNYGSRKAAHLAQNPRAALLFPWITIERQVEVTGHVKKIPEEESLAYFLSRPAGSQLGAWVSEQSSEIPSREFLLARFEEMKSRFSTGPIPKPDFWGGYCLEPETIEFWQGGRDRLHDRFRYTQKNRTWSHVRLSP